MSILLYSYSTGTSSYSYSVVPGFLCPNRLDGNWDIIELISSGVDYAGTAESNSISYVSIIFSVPYFTSVLSSSSLTYYSSILSFSCSFTFMVCFFVLIRSFSIYAIFYSYFRYYKLPSIFSKKG